MSSVKYTSHKKEVLSDLEKNKQNKLYRAAKHVQKAIRAKINDEYFDGYHSMPGEPPGKVTGNLRKGIQVKVPRGQDMSVVGAKAPAHHAFLLELGTAKMAPRPFFLTTWLEEKSAVKEIVSESWE